MLNEELRIELREKVLSKKADIITVRKKNSKKTLILVSEGAYKWELFNKSTCNPLMKALEILEIDSNVLNNDSLSINYSMWEI